MKGILTMDKLLKPELFKITSFFKGDSIDPILITNQDDKNIDDLIAYILEKVEIKRYDQKKNRETSKNINKPLTVNQLRKFYDSFLKIYNNTSDEKEKKVQLIMLKANAEYSAKRLETKRFNIFFSNRINLVVAKQGEEFKKNLNAFKLHLEALVAYYPKNIKDKDDE